MPIVFFLFAHLIFKQKIQKNHWRVFLVHFNNFQERYQWNLIFTINFKPKNMHEYMFPIGFILNLFYIVTAIFQFPILVNTVRARTFSRTELWAYYTAPCYTGTPKKVRSAKTPSVCQKFGTVRKKIRFVKNPMRVLHK